MAGALHLSAYQAHVRCSVSDVAIHVLPERPKGVSNVESQIPCWQGARLEG